MTFRVARRFALTTTAAALVLGLASCGKEDPSAAASGTPVVSATPHANVPPPAGKPTSRRMVPVCACTGVAMAASKAAPRAAEERVATTRLKK